MKQGVCVIIDVYGNEEVLAISRRNNHTLWGLPGGKVDQGESPEEAAVRELKEECGLNLDKHHLVPIYVGPCYGKDGNDFWTTAYYYDGPVNQIPEACEEGFKLSVMPFIKLANETVSPFANYNLNVIPKLRHFVRMTIESED